jgi:hypothetical protein
MGELVPQDLAGAIRLVTHIINAIRKDPPATPAAADAQLTQLDSVIERFTAARGAILANVNLVEVRLERARDAESEARRAAERARSPESRELHERRLMDAEEEVSHLSRLAEQMQVQRVQLAEAATVARRGRRLLQRAAERLAVASQAAAVAEARVLLLEGMLDYQRQLDALQRDIDHQTAEQRGRVELAREEDFIRSIELDDLDSRIALEERLRGQRP